MSLLLSGAASGAGRGVPAQTVTLQQPPDAARFSILPPDAQSAISGALGRDLAAYHAVGRGGDVQVTNPRHGLSVDFTSRGVRVRAGTARWGMRLERIGYGGDLRKVPSAAPRAIANRVEYQRGTATEWYVNGPLGLEQGFTLQAPPGESKGKALTLVLGLSGNVSASLDPAGQVVTLTRAGEGPSLRYRGLTAFDADGRRLQARLELNDGDLLVRVDDQEARYPIVVDPFVEQAQLSGSDPLLNMASVAISGDTIVVSAWSWPPSVVAWLFVKPAAGWASMTETAKLMTTDGVPGGFVLTSVAINGDTVVIGAPDASGPGGPHSGGPGSAYVFVKPATGWPTMMTETAKLTPSDGAAGDGFGSAVGISGDTVVVGAPYVFAAGIHRGSAYLFVEASGGWASMTETAKLTSATGGEFGFSVAISGDTVAAGSWAEVPGSVYVFVKPATGWSTTSVYAADLTVSSSFYSDGFGAQVAIDQDAATIASSAYIVGKAYIFEKPVTGWATTSAFTAELGSILGLGVAIALDGDNLVVGADTGSAYVFVKPATGWATTSDFTAELTPAEGTALFSGVNGVGVSGDMAVGVDLWNNVARVFGMPAACDDGNPCTDDSGDPESGCVHANSTNPCDDGNLCTTGDTCSDGACGGSPVVCEAADQCHDAGTCAPETGTCNPAKADGTVCDDGNAATTGDVCTGGLCTGTDLCAGVICTALDQCHQAGVCDSGTGHCSNPSQPNGSTCDDGNACTQSDTCQGGQCVGTDYSWSGVLQPINPDGSSIFKMGSTIPVKFQLEGACAGITNLNARLFLTMLSSDIGGSEIEATSTAAADSGNTFRYSASNNQYIFNLATKPLSVGTWRLRIDLGDGVLDRSVMISLRK